MQVHRVQPAQPLAHPQRKVVQHRITAASSKSNAAATPQAKQYAVVNRTFADALRYGSKTQRANNGTLYAVFATLPQAQEYVQQHCTAYLPQRLANGKTITQRVTKAVVVPWY